MKNSERTRKSLIAHCHSYPRLQVQDVFKFLYQSAFGCEHAVSSLEQASARIESEYDPLHQTSTPVIQPLDGSYSRVPLSYMGGGLTASTFAKLFLASSQCEKDGLSALLEKIEVAKKLVQDGLLPFAPQVFESALEKWKETEYAAIHHSDDFKKTYRPSYRVIANRYLPFLPLFSALDKRLANQKVLLAVEGGSASGKTTLGDLLAFVYPCTVFHMDDYFLQPWQRTPERFKTIGGNVDWERFLSEILEPLSRGETVRFRKFDCSSMSLRPPEHISPENLVIVEGAYSMHPALERFYDLSVFLDISPALQRKRIRKRNTPELVKRFFEEWIPLEQTYFTQTNIRQRCNMSIQIPEA